ncbi:MAG: PilZ domain-containing protein [Myxococcota bacterium]
MNRLWRPVGSGVLESEYRMNKAGQQDERRDSARHEVKVGVTMTSDSNLYVGFTDNISEGGLFVATHELLDIGEHVTLEFELPETEEKLRVDGEVRWHRMAARLDDDIFPGFGVKFLELGDKEQAKLQEFLEQRDPLFHPD